MKSETSKKVSRNFIFGIFGQAITLILGIIIPRLFIVSFGSEVNGFINSMNQVFTYVALLEAGVGGASLQALYLPVGTNNKDKINGILSATNYFYNRTGILYILAVVVLSVIYPMIVESELSWSLMATLVLLSGLSGAIPYFFQAKYKLLLRAEGKDYVISVLTTFTSIMLSSSKLTLLLLGFNVIIVQSVYLIINLLVSLIYIIYIKRNYKWLDLKVVPDTQSILQKNSVIVHQISTLIFNNTDILILTFCCDLSTVSIYVLYRNLIAMISTLLNIFLNSVNFKLGQTFHDREKFLNLFDIYETFHIALTFSLCTIAYVCITPFMKLYTAGMDANYIMPYLPLLMIILEILNYGRMPSLNLTTYAGHFKQTQWRAVLEATINLISSLILVNFMGIYGVVLGTIIALLYRTNDMIIYGNKKILNRSPVHEYKIWLINIILSVITVFIFNLLKLQLYNYFMIIITAVIMCIFCIPIYVLLSYAVNFKTGREALRILKPLLNKNLFHR